MIHIEIDPTGFRLPRTQTWDILCHLGQEILESEEELPHTKEDALPIYDLEGMRVGRIWNSLIEPCDFTRR